MKVIAISGTPATGKTTLARKLSKKLNFKYLDINKIIVEYNLSEGYDKKRRCRIIDVKKLNNQLIKLISQYKRLSKTNKNKINGLIIDSHLSHYLPKKYVDLCIITKCSLKTLAKRLKKRGYSKNKIRENLDCEIFDVCYNEAVEKKHKIVIINTNNININKISSEIVWPILRQKS